MIEGTLLFLSFSFTFLFQTPSLLMITYVAPTLEEGSSTSHDEGSRGKRVKRVKRQEGPEARGSREISETTPRASLSQHSGALPGGAVSRRFLVRSMRRPMRRLLAESGAWPGGAVSRGSLVRSMRRPTPPRPPMGLPCSKKTPTGPLMRLRTKGSSQLQKSPLLKTCPLRKSRKVALRRCLLKLQKLLPDPRFVFG